MRASDELAERALRAAASDYRGTVAEPMFENLADEEGDDDLRARADQLALDRPPGVPESLHGSSSPISSSTQPR
jgi:hypothetical protein